MLAAYNCVLIIVDNSLLSLSSLDLDLDLTRIQVDALGHTPTPFWSVKSCHLCFFPDERHLSQMTVPIQLALGRPGPLL